MTAVPKEMVAGMPVQRLADYLKSVIHRSFTVEADYMLGDGLLDEQERILLSNQISRALDAFSDGLPESIATRPLNPLGEISGIGFADKAAQELLKDEEFKRGILQRMVARILPRREGLDKAYRNAAAVLLKGKEDWYLVGIYSNKFMDRDGEIIPFAAHKEYAEWTKRIGFRPVITLMHQPKLPSDFWTKVFDQWGEDGEKLNKIVREVYDEVGLAEVLRIVPSNGFVAYVARVLPGKEKAVERLEAQKDLGMSHGFILLSKDNNILSAYRSFELSYLPRRRAANLFTDGIFGGKRMTNALDEKISAEDAQWMAGILGEEIVELLDSGTGDLEKKLERILAFKDSMPLDEVEKSEDESMDKEKEVVEEVTEAPQPEDVVEEEVAVEAETPVEETKEVPTYEEIRKQLTEDFAIPQLGAVLKDISDKLAVIESRLGKVEGLDAQVAELRKSQDEKVAEHFAPPAWSHYGYSPSQSAANVVGEKEAEEMTEEAPKGTAPVDPNSPLYMLTRALEARPKK